MANSTARSRTAEPSPPLSRRTVILGASAGLVLSAVGTTSASAAPSYSSVPKLPYEVSRTDTRTTRLGKKAYESIDVVVAGDRAKLFVPHSAPPSLKKPAAAIWFYHSNGSTNTSLDGAYRYGAEMLVDRGALAICPDYGGASDWTNATAVKFQKVWARYLPSVWKIATSFARANSGGGALMSWAYGNRLLPYQRGMYLANGTYDMEALYASAPERIGPPYDDDPALVRATNPARLSGSHWAGSRIKTVVSLSDPYVPPKDHGLKLAALAEPVATDVRVQYHDQGHVIPSWTQQDMVTTFASWM